MEPEKPIKTTFSPSDLKLFVYGSRQSDQFWLPNSNSHSKKPVCLTEIQKFTFNNEDDEDQGQNKQQKQPIPNPLFNQVVYKVACGSIHSIVLTIDGRVFTFGCNDQGALGRKGIQCIPLQVQLQDPIDLIAAGDNHSLFANSVNGAVYFTGNYNYKRGEMMTNSLFQPIRIYTAQFNITNKNKRIQKLACGANHSCILIAGKVFCRGQPQASTIGRRISKRHKVQNSLTFNGVNISDVVDIQCGGYHTVVKVTKHKKNKYYSWGTNDHGQLGIGTFQSQAFPVQIKKLKDKDIVQMTAGSSFTLFLSSEGQLYGCGNNQDSNLGLGQDFQFQSSSEEESQQKQPISGQKHNNEQIQANQVKKSLQNLAIQAKEPLKINQQVNQISQNKDPVKQSSQMKNEQKQIKNESQMKNEAKQTIKGQQAIKNQAKQIQQKQHRDVQQKKSYIKSIVKIPLPAKVTNISAGQNFGFAWNKQNLYTWGMGYGYVLLNGQQNDETQPFQVKNKIIRNHTIHELDAGNQHVLYTSYPQTIKDSIKIEPKPSVWENLSIAKTALKRKR